MNLLNNRQRKSLNTSIVDCYWRESRLPWLDWFCYVWLELDWSECIRQSGIWTSPNGEQCCGLGPRLVPRSVKNIINLEWQSWSKGQSRSSHNINEALHDKQYSTDFKTDADLPFVEDSSCFLTFSDSFWDFPRLSGNICVLVLSECFGVGSCTTLLDIDCFDNIAPLLIASKPSIQIDMFLMVLVTSPGACLLHNTDWTGD